MASITDICNLALSRIGHGRIASISEGTKAADYLSLHYPIARDAMLRDHTWNFSIRRQTLAASATAPNHEWDYKFALPSDCLKVIRTDLDDLGGEIVNAYPYTSVTPYAVEGRFLLTNEDEVSLEYVSQATDTTQFDSLFVDCLAQRLAAELAMPLADNASLAKSMWDIYAMKVREARATDSQEGTPREAVDATGWLMARV
jgi:hypothetical protein